MSIEPYIVFNVRKENIGKSLHVIYNLINIPAHQCSCLSFKSEFHGYIHVHLWTIILLKNFAFKIKSSIKILFRRSTQQHISESLANIDETTVDLIPTPCCLYINENMLYVHVMQ